MWTVYCKLDSAYIQGTPTLFSILTFASFQWYRRMVVERLELNPRVTCLTLSKIEHQHLRLPRYVHCFSLVPLITDRSFEFYVHMRMIFDYITEHNLLSVYMF